MTSPSSSSPRRRVYPVIHYLRHELAIEQARLAYRLGADGVFLIHHENDDAEVMRTAAQLVRERPAGKSLGVNLLVTPALQTLEWAVKNGVDAIWEDRPGIHSSGEDPVAVEIEARLAALAQPPQYFASIAFKGQPHDPRPDKSALRARELRMIPTTSGPGTGQPPSVDKIADVQRALAAARPEVPRLAVASGMDCDNVGLFLPYLTDILVATGVAADEHHFDPDKLERFIGIVAAFKAPG